MNDRTDSGTSGSPAPGPHPRSLAGGWRGAVRHAARLWALSFACLIPVVAVAMFALRVGRGHTGQPFTLFEAVLFFIDWSLWAVLAPGIVGLVWLVPLNRGHWVHGLVTHLAAGAALAVGELALFVAVAKAVGGFAQVTFATGYWRVFTVWYPYALLVYWVIAIAAHAALVSRRAREREVEAVRLREQLTAARLEALRMQLHPHFLCNTLNTVAVFLRDGKVEPAEEIVTGLGALLHTALDRMDTQEVTLRDELTFVGQYLEIERIRFSDRMKVSLETRDDVLDALVPCMILQPVVENAIRHGISRDPHAGHVSIRAVRTNGRLDLVVEDDGPGLGNGAPSPGHGVGLENARMRLASLYGERGGIRLGPGIAGGARVEISLPFHTAPAPPGGRE